MKALGERFPEYVPIVVLAIHTGPRRSALFRARLGDYDPHTRLMKARQRKTKKASAIRYVQMTPMAIEAYNTLAKGKAVGAVLCSQQEDVESPLTQSDYWFKPCVEAAKILDFNFHDLHHTAASRWVMNWTPLAVVAGYLGHTNIQMTMRYSLLQPGNNEGANEAMMRVYAEENSHQDSIDTHEAA